MKKRVSRPGFTMLELIVVIVIVGILSSIAFLEYSKTIERSRTAEARTTLGKIRDAQIIYFLDHQAYADLSDLAVEPPTTCTSTHYFHYSAAAGSNIATATRCIVGEGGKTDGPSAYDITLNYDTGEFGGDAGYY